MKKHSKAREKTAEVVALYRDGLKAKPIALRLAISPRIVREILIEQGVYAPNNPGNGEESKPARLRNLHSAMLDVLRKVGKREAQRQTVGDLHAAMVRVVKRRGPCKATGAPRGLSNVEYCAWRYVNDPQYRIRQLLRQRMKKVIKRGQKTGSTLDLLGCSTEHVRAHIESQFKPGMNWNNGGTGKGKWHIDHRIPCASFNLTDKAQQRLCFHWTNLQPMWSIANMKKGRHLHRHEQTSLHISK
jgi:hypothetical protein